MGPDKEEDRRVAQTMSGHFNLAIAGITLINNVIFFFRHGFADVSPSRALWIFASLVFLYQYFKTPSQKAR